MEVIPNTCEIGETVPGPRTVSVTLRGPVVAHIEWIDDETSSE